MSSSAAIRGLVCEHGAMRSPYGLDIIESCLGCKLREDYLFCNLPEATVRHLERIRSVATYPAGALLFLEGQEARGIFILCNGRAKLSTSSSVRLAKNSFSRTTRSTSHQVAR